ncbi:hypothetical protein FBU30_008917 [Linnemannia zychae]|nr:hypothetical protein FBU30_008917 [Linnemannia zychae]
MIIQSLPPNLQAVRRVYENDVAAARTTSTPRIFHIPYYSDPTSGEDIILWDDILAAFKGDVVHVLSGTIILPFLKGPDFKNLEPLRIAALPEVTLDIVLSGSRPNTHDLSMDSLLKALPDTPKDSTHVSTSIPTCSDNAATDIHRASERTFAARDQEPQASQDNLLPSYSVSQDFTSPDNNNELPDYSSDLSSSILHGNFEEIMAMAKLGNNPARIALGDMYLDGQGVEKDVQEAIDWYLLAARDGNSCAEFKIGRLCYSDGAMTQDCTIAINRYWKEAIEGGSGEAQCNIGNLCYYGKNYSQALVWYNKAADQGNAIAQNQLGFMYGKGYGIPRDYSQAMIWYRKSAENENSSGQCNVGFMYNNGYGVPQDYTQAITWYRKSAENGNDCAQCNIGYMYFNGVGVVQNYSQALVWYRKAAEQGNAIAQSDIGYMYHNGLGTSRSFSEAMKWYRKAASQDITVSQVNLGYMYQHGQGVHQDYAQAMVWFKKAADLGRASAQFRIGSMYEFGLGIEKDESKAREWYKKAVDGGDEIARSSLERLEKKVKEEKKSHGFFSFLSR